MDPMSFMSGMSGSPSFQGGDSGPAFSEATGSTVNAWMASPFAIGSGATATPSAVGFDGQVMGLGMGGASMAPMALAAVALLVGLVALKKR